MELKRFSLVFPILAVALMVSLFGCGGANSKPTGIPVTPQLFISTLAWGTTGTGTGQFDFPDGVAVAPDGSVYVTDGLNSHIQKFASEGVFVSQWGTWGYGNGQFDKPYGVEVAPDGSVYIADAYNNRIQKFTSEGVFVGKSGTEATSDGQFHEPHGVAVASDGSVYVADMRNNRIQKFSPGP